MRYLVFLVLVALLLGACTSNDQADQTATDTEQGPSAEGDPQADPPTATADKEILPLGEDEIVAAEFIRPSAAEVFNALDKLGTVEWSGIGSFNTKTSYDNDYLRALNLGVRGADAFIAIEAEDEGKFGDMAATLFDLGGDLGIGQALLDQREALDQMAGEGSWAALRSALDSLQTGIDEEIQRLNEPDLVVLAGVSGWLEGLRAITSHLKENYTEEASSILYQPGLVAYYSSQLDTLEAGAKVLDVVTRISSDLNEIRELVNVGPELPVSLEAVTRLHEISATLVSQIEEG